MFTRLFHGRVCKEHGRRHYAVPKPSTLTDRIAARNIFTRAPWDQVEHSAADGVRARVFKNIR